MADSYAVERVLENSTELITEEEVETVPEKLIGIKVTEANMNAARPLFTDDAWLVVKTSLGIKLLRSIICLNPFL
jgi:hypothetical protein